MLLNINKKYSNKQLSTYFKVDNLIFSFVMYFLYLQQKANDKFKVDSLKFNVMFYYFFMFKTESNR